MSEETTAALRARLEQLRRARADLPPHSAQQWRTELDHQISDLRRRLAAREDGG